MSYIGCVSKTDDLTEVEWEDLIDEEEGEIVPLDTELFVTIEEGKRPTLQPKTTGYLYPEITLGSVKFIIQRGCSLRYILAVCGNAWGALEDSGPPEA